MSPTCEVLDAATRAFSWEPQATGLLLVTALNPTLLCFATDQHKQTFVFFGVISVHVLTLNLSRMT